MAIQSSQRSSASTASSQPEQRHLDIIAASARGNYDKVRSVLKEGGPWNSSRDDSALRKALQKASARDNVDIIKLLLQFGAQVDARTDDEFPALFRAAQAGQTAVVTELLEHGSHLEVQSRDGQTALFAAGVRGFKNVVKMLLEKGAHVDAEDRDGRTPLLALAADKGSISVWTAGAEESTWLLISYGANLEAKDNIGRTSLLWAVTNGHYELVKMLLVSGADVSAANDRGRTALHLAVDSSEKSQNARRHDIVELLLQYNADARATSDGGWTPLHNAAQKGLRSVVQLLLHADADVNATLSNGMTALHWAAFNGFEDTVRIILRREDVDLTIKDGFGRLPWLCAAEKGHDDLVELLSPLRNRDRLPKTMQDACKAFTATVVEFKRLGEKQRIFKHSVYDTLYGWDEKKDRPKVPLWSNSAGFQNDFKWVHLPANNTLWAETLLSKWFIESGCRDLEIFKAVTKCFEQEHRGALPQAFYMRPFCHRISAVHSSEESGSDTAMLSVSPTPLMRRTSSNLSQLSLNPTGTGGDGKIMPYLHYETDEGRQKMTDAVRIIKAADEAMSSSTSPNMLLLQAYLPGKPSIHPRRTLDQFFYHAIDTSTRDRDQVVYRHCARHGQERKIFMVDQLWLWILGKDLVVTCFPERWEHRGRDPLNVLNGVIEEMNAKTRAPVRSVYDLAILISNRCSGMFSRHGSDDHDYQFLDMFESSVGRVTEELTQLFHRFEEASTHSQQWLRPKRRHRILKSLNEDDSFDPLLDIRAETSLLTEVRDIRDEFNILTMILNSQIFTLSDFKTCMIDELSAGYGSSRRVGNFAADVRKRTLEQERRLKIHKRDIDAMDQQAERLYRSLTDLLDLKQKHSNALEARFSSEQALAAAKEGQTVMVFTIVTIIFLPMSFIAAYFGISIETWGDGLDASYVATWVFGVGLAISAVFVIMAFTVVDITKALNAIIGIVKGRPNHKKKQTNPRRAEELQHPYESVKSRSAETIVGDYDLDDNGRKLNREQSRASGVSALSKTFSQLSGRNRGFKDDLEKGGCTTPPR
ncbi:ankyrin repeat-containing domain protein [Xylariales sp. PMI_506]|nr:ankyrin repeat-containing domain protein [Xylariales sp. PMI_506]